MFVMKLKNKIYDNTGSMSLSKTTTGRPTGVNYFLHFDRVSDVDNPYDQKVDSMFFWGKKELFCFFFKENNVVFFSNIGIHTNAINNLPIIYLHSLSFSFFFSGMFTEIKQMNKVKSVYILRIDSFL